LAFKQNGRISVKKSFFLLGNMILSTSSAPTPLAMIASIKGAVEMTPLSAPEIVDGLNQSKVVLTAEANKSGKMSDTYSALSDLQALLKDKARIAGLNSEHDGQLAFLGDDGNLIDAPARAARTMNGAGHQTQQGDDSVTRQTDA